MSDTPSIVLELHEQLDLNGIEWVEVRDYPQATFLPTTQHTVWWQAAISAFRWGHQFEYEDPTVEAVIARLKEESQ